MPQQLIRFDSLVTLLYTHQQSGHTSRCTAGRAPQRRRAATRSQTASATSSLGPRGTSIGCRRRRARGGVVRGAEGEALADLVDDEQVAALARRAWPGRGRARPSRRRSRRRSRRSPARARPRCARRARRGCRGCATSATAAGLAGGLLDLGVAAGGGPEVGDGGGHDDRVGVGRRRRARPRAARAAVPTRTTLTPAGSGSATLAATSVTSAPRAAAVAGQRVALPAGGAVAEEAHRVEGLAGAAGGDDDVPPGQVARGRAPRASTRAADLEDLGRARAAGPGRCRRR